MRYNSCNSIDNLTQSIAHSPEVWCGMKVVKSKLRFLLVSNYRVFQMPVIYVTNYKLMLKTKQLLGPTALLLPFWKQPSIFVMPSTGSYPSFSATPWLLCSISDPSITCLGCLCRPLLFRAEYLRHDLRLRLQTDKLSNRDEPKNTWDETRNKAEMQADETREKAEMDYDPTPMGGSM